MYLAKKTYNSTPEFLKSACYQNVSCTVDDTGIAPDGHGKKYVPGGSLLDRDGRVVTITRSGSAGSYTYSLSADPAGILFCTTDVTHGPQPGALMIDGAVNTERLPGDYCAEAVQELIHRMPFIKFFVDGVLQIKI